MTDVDPPTGRWWPVASAAEVAAADGFLPVRLLDEPWLLTRLDGSVVAVRDECPHRRIPLSAGRRVATAAGERLECRYHGWRFDQAGACSQIPALGDTGNVPAGMRVRTSPIVETHKVFWLAPWAAGLQPRPLIQPRHVDEPTPEPIRFALPAAILLRRVQEMVGGDLAGDDWSVQLRWPQPSSELDRSPGLVTFIAQPEGREVSRLFAIWLGGCADADAAAGLWRTVAGLGDVRREQPA